MPGLTSEACDEALGLGRGVPSVGIQQKGAPRVRRKDRRHTRTVQIHCIPPFPFPCWPAEIPRWVLPQPALAPSPSFYPCVFRPVHRWTAPLAPFLWCYPCVLRLVCPQPALGLFPCRRFDILQPVRQRPALPPFLALVLRLIGVLVVKGLLGRRVRVELEGRKGGKGKGGVRGEGGCICMVTCGGMHKPSAFRGTPPVWCSSGTSDTLRRHQLLRFCGTATLPLLCSVPARYTPAVDSCSRFRSCGRDLG